MRQLQTVPIPLNVRREDNTMELIIKRQQKIDEMLEALKPWFGDYMYVRGSGIHLIPTNCVIAYMLTSGNSNVNNVDWYEENKAKVLEAGKYFNYHSTEHLSDLVAYPFIYNTTHNASLILEGHQSSENRPQNKKMIITREMLETRLNAIKER